MKTSRHWLVLLLASLALGVSGCGSGSPETEAPSEAQQPTETATLEPPGDEAAAEDTGEVAEPEAAPKTEGSETKTAPKAAPQSTNPIVVMETSKGVIRVELFPDKAPKTVENFLQYVNDGFYDGTIFHRVMPDFVIQGGGLTPNMAEKETRAPIENEAKNGLSNERGTIAMARTWMPHSAKAQFFINHGSNSNLDNSEDNGWGYAVFGKVIDGMEVVDAIAAVKTANVGPHANVPVEPVVIRSIRRLS